MIPNCWSWSIFKIPKWLLYIVHYNYNQYKETESLCYCVYFLLFYILIGDCDNEYSTSYLAAKPGINLSARNNWIKGIVMERNYPIKTEAFILFKIHPFSSSETSDQSLCCPSMLSFFGIHSMWKKIESRTNFTHWFYLKLYLNT